MRAHKATGAYAPVALNKDFAQFVPEHPHPQRQHELQPQPPQGQEAEVLAPPTDCDCCPQEQPLEPEELFDPAEPEEPLPEEVLQQGLQQRWETKSGNKSGQKPE